MNEPTNVRPQASLASAIGMASGATALMLFGGFFWFKMNPAIWTVFGVLIVALWVGLVWLRLGKPK